MEKEAIYAFAGAILGSLIEEGVEEYFPGIGELGWTGEISGALAGLLKSRFDREEIRSSLEMFIKYAYRRINKNKAEKEIPENDLKLFSENFKTLPKKIKKEIINNFKNLSPYEYNLIREFMKGLEGAKE